MSIDYVFPPFEILQKWALANGYSGSTDDEAYAAYREAHPDGVMRIARERRRQIVEKIRTIDMDLRVYNGHRIMELASAAGSYIMNAVCSDMVRDHHRERSEHPMLWPWDSRYWKPGLDNSLDSKIRELEKAGALIAAQIDVLLATKERQS